MKKKEKFLPSALSVAFVKTETEGIKQAIKLDPDYSTDFVLEYDNEGYIIYCNPAATQKLGYHRHEILNRHFTEFVSKDHVEKVIGFYQNQFKQKNEQCYFEFKYLTKNKKEYWVGQKSILILNNGWIEGVKTIGIDITEKKQWDEVPFDSWEIEIKVNNSSGSNDKIMPKALIVEGNKMNQLVAAKFLQRWGISSDSVDNGKEAIKHLINYCYDVVLIDLHMTEMDGFETCKHIRENLPSPYCEVPIISLSTADKNEMVKNTQLTGINFFIAKPFNPIELQKIILGLISKKNQVKGKDKNIFVEANELTNLQYLYDISNGSHEFVKSIIEVFIQQTPTHLLELEEACKINKWEDISMVAHKTKGTFNTLGIKSLEENIELIENLSEAKRGLETIIIEIEKINTTCQQVYKELEKKLSII